MGFISFVVCEVIFSLLLNNQCSTPRSLVHWQGEAQEPDQGLMSQCVSVARANLAPLDLFVVRRTGAELRVGFLSLGWGLIPDVDLDSEAIRWRGWFTLSVL